MTVVVGSRFIVAESIKMFCAIIESGSSPAKEDVAKFLEDFGKLKRQPRLPADLTCAIAALLRPVIGRGKRRSELPLIEFVGRLRAIDRARQLSKQNRLPFARALAQAAEQYRLSVGMKTLEALATNIKRGRVRVPALALESFSHLHLP